MIRFRGTDVAACSGLCSQQAHERGCVRNVNGYSYNFCSACTDPKVGDPKCGPWFVPWPSTAACEDGCAMDVGSEVQADSPLHGGVFSIRASTSSSSSLKDVVSGITLTPKAVTEYAGHDCWNLDNDYLEYVSGSSKPLYGQYYTLAVWVFWRGSDGPWWRTLLHGSSDHGILVKDGAKDLGMYSNRNGGFRDSSYDIDNDMSTWQLVIVTGSGNTATSSIGTSIFFTAAEGDVAVQQRGTADRVVSGTEFFQVGHPGQGPGKIAAVHQFNRILTVAEMNRLLAKGVGAEAVQATATTTTTTFTTTAPACDERLFGDGSGYRGCQDKTRTGKSCVRWHAQLSLGKGTSILHNYCRNPDGDTTIWCYTSQYSNPGGGYDWGYCDPKACTDSNDGATDSYGDGCTWYTEEIRDNPNSGDCGRFDDSDFAALTMCCSCGGGGPYQAPTPAPTTAPTPAPTLAPTPAGYAGAQPSWSTGAGSATFRLTQNSYKDGEHLGACSSEFGASSKIADWAENLGRLSVEQVGAMTEKLGIPVSSNERSYFVTWHGQGSYNGGRRSYNFERHDGQAPANWLVHDQRGGLSLGSWFDIEGLVLCVQTMTTTMTTTTTIATTIMTALPTTTTKGKTTSTRKSKTTTTTTIRLLS